MHLAGINVDDELIQASRSGDLAIFAGAGVSMGEPTNLPGFEKLVDDIKERVDPSHRIGDRNDESFIRYLGYLEKECGGVHEACAEALGADKHSSPKHQAIVSLFDGHPLKLITTNFDLCFEEVLHERKTSTAVFSAPALPLGDQFNGLVHLHGNISDPQNQVLTDIDFGDAYVTRSWASRFLVDTFRSNTVLFIGYSCDDDLVDYLTRSMSASSPKKAHAFVGGKSDDPENWTARGVTPIWYGEEHECLTRILNAWVRHLSEGPYPKALRARRIAEGDPRFIQPDDEDFLLALFHEDRKENMPSIDEFFRYARDPQWFSWLRRHNLTKALFAAQPSKVEQKVVAWTARNYAYTEYEQLAAIRRECREEFSENVFQEVFDSLASQECDDNCVAHWLLELSSRPTVRDGWWLGKRTLDAVSKTQNPHLVLFCIKLFAGIEGPLSPTMKIRCDHFEDDLMKLIEDHPEISLEVFRHAISQLQTCYEIETRLHTQDTSFDAASFERQRLDDPFPWRHGPSSPHDLLLKLALTAGDHALQLSPKPFSQEIDSCTRSPHELIARIGYLFFPQTGHTADECLEIFSETDALRKLLCRHEAYQLIASAFAEAGATAKESLIDYIEAALPGSPDSNSDRSAVRKKYDLFHLLLRSDPGNVRLSAKAKEIQIQYPEWVPKDNPGVCFEFLPTKWIGSIDVSPTSAQNFTYEFCRKCLSDEYETDVFMTPTEPIESSAAKYPQQVPAIVGKCLDGAVDEPDEKILAILAAQTSWADLYDIDAEACIDTLQQLLSHPTTTREALFSICITRDDRRLQDSLTPTDFEKLANTIGDQWELLASSPTTVKSESSADWVTQAINHPIGHFFDFLASMAIRVREGDGEAGASEFISKYEPLIYQALALPSPTPALTSACLFTRVNLWERLSPTLFSEGMLPLLTCQGSGEDASWEGLSYCISTTEEVWRRVSPLLHDRFRARISFDSEIANRLASAYVWGLIVWEADDQRRIELLPACLAASKEAARGALEQIRYWLDQLDTSEQREAAWSSWIAPSLGRAIQQADQDTQAIAEGLVRIIGLSLMPNKLIVDFIADHIDHLAGDPFLPDEHVSAICNDPSISENNKAAFLILLLESGRYYHLRDPEVHIAKIQIEEVSDSLVDRLKNALTQCDQTDIAEQLEKETGSTE